MRLQEWFSNAHLYPLCFYSTS